MVLLLLYFLWASKSWSYEYYSWRSYYLASSFCGLYTDTSNVASIISNNSNYCHPVAAWQDSSNFHPKVAVCYWLCFKVGNHTWGLLFWVNPILLIYSQFSPNNSSKLLKFQWLFCARLFSYSIGRYRHKRISDSLKGWDNEASYPSSMASSPLIPIGRFLFAESHWGREPSIWIVLMIIVGFLWGMDLWNLLQPFLTFIDISPTFSSLL